MLTEFWKEGGRQYVSSLVAPRQYDVLPKWYNCIIIDDIGTEPILNNFGTKEDVLTETINERYIFVENSRKKTEALTYVSTNLSDEKLSLRYGERTYSRLRALCNFIEVTGDDKRLI
jgi:DNA replication protein DnaC